MRQVDCQVGGLNTNQAREYMPNLMSKWTPDMVASKSMLSLIIVPSQIKLKNLSFIRKRKIKENPLVAT